MGAQKIRWLLRKQAHTHHVQSICVAWSNMHGGDPAHVVHCRAMDQAYQCTLAEQGLKVTVGGVPYKILSCFIGFAGHMEPCTGASADGLHLVLRRLCKAKHVDEGGTAAAHDESASVPSIWQVFLPLGRSRLSFGSWQGKAINLPIAVGEDVCAKAGLPYEHGMSEMMIVWQVWMIMIFDHY